MTLTNLIAKVRYQFVRGSGFISAGGIGFLLVDAIQRRWPDTINTILFFMPSTYQFIFLFVLSMLGVWFLGFMDFWLKLFHAEGKYSFQENPRQMEILERLERIEKKLEVD